MGTIVVSGCNDSVGFHSIWPPFLFHQGHLELCNSNWVFTFLLTNSSICQFSWHPLWDVYVCWTSWRMFAPQTMVHRFPWQQENSSTQWRLVHCCCGRGGLISKAHLWNNDFSEAQSLKESQPKDNQHTWLMVRFKTLLIQWLIMAFCMHTPLHTNKVQFFLNSVTVATPQGLGHCTEFRSGLRQQLEVVIPSCRESVCVCVTPTYRENAV